MADRVDAFLGGLRDLGYVEGQTIAIEWRFSTESNDPSERCIDPNSRAQANATVLWRNTNGAFPNPCYTRTVCELWLMMMLFSIAFGGVGKSADAKESLYWT